MILTNEIIRTLKFAINAHSKQVRKYTKEPYVNHPINVMKIVSTVEHDENMLCASLLHDVVEDTDYTIDEICEYFGHDIAKLVDGLTDKSILSDGNRRKRKEIDREALSTKCSRVQTIKLADLIDNSTDIIVNDVNFAVVYIKEKEKLLKVLDKGNKVLYNEAKKIVDEYYNVL